MSSYSHPITILLERLQGHISDPGALLQGWTLHRGITTKVEGITDFPSLRIYVPEGREEYQACNVAIGSFDVNLLVSTRLSLGIVGWLDGVALVMDAIDTTPEGAVDSLLGGSLVEPVGYRFTAVHAVDAGIGLHGSLYVRMVPQRVVRGQRHA